MSNNPKPWIESVHLHPDVLKENAATDIFALDLGPLADGSGTVAPVYRDAESFFRASYVTVGLRSLLDEVLKRLAGKGGSPVLKLMTPFGGGKSHTMAAGFSARLRWICAAPTLPQRPQTFGFRTAHCDGPSRARINGWTVQAFRNGMEIAPPMRVDSR